MMASIAELPESEGSRLATVELWRRPDGSLVFRLVDMPVTVIENYGWDARERMLLLAGWAKVAAVQLETQAAALAGAAA